VSCHFLQTLPACLSVRHATFTRHEPIDRLEHAQLRILKREARTPIGISNERERERERELYLYRIAHAHFFAELMEFLFNYVFMESPSLLCFRCFIVLFFLRECLCVTQEIYLRAKLPRIQKTTISHKLYSSYKLRHPVYYSMY
jgi:hypothetical protein